MPTDQISITLPLDVREVIEAEAARAGSTLAPFIRHTLVQLVKHQGWSRPAAPPAPVAAAPPSPAAAPAPPVLVDIVGRPRAPDAFDTDYEPPQPPAAVRRVPDPAAPRRWKYKPPA